MAKTGKVYRRGNQWWIDFTYRKKRYREPVGPNEQLAIDTLAKRKVQIRENRFFPDKMKEVEPIKFYDFAKEYLQWARVNKKPSTYERDISTMRRLENYFGNCIIQDLTTWQIEKWKSKRKEAVAPATVNRELSLLKHIYSKAIESGKCRENPANRSVKRLKGEVERVRYLIPDEIQILLSNCTDHLRPIVTIALNTGMRRGELLGLRWDQVNFDQGIISILNTKNDKRRDIPMTETAKEVLSKLEKNKIGDYVFCNGEGKNFVSVRKSFETALKKSKIDDFRFHDLRHTFASNLVMQGIDIMTVRELMGHKTLEMTLRYAHLAPDHKAKAIKILDKIFTSQNLPQFSMPSKVIYLSA